MEGFRFVEMCSRESPISALLYLQTSLAAVVDHRDEAQATAFQQCMQNVITAPQSIFDDVDMNGHYIDKEDPMAISQHYLPKLTTTEVSDQFWEHRTRLFEDLLTFFPTGSMNQQPEEELVDLLRHDDLH